MRVERTPVQARQADSALKRTLPADAAGRADYAEQVTPEQSGAAISAQGLLGALASPPGSVVASVNKASIAPAPPAAPVASGAPRTALSPQQSASARLYKPLTNRASTPNQESLAAQAERAFASLLNTKGGEVRFLLDGQPHAVRLTRAHLEEDAGKSLHEDFHGMSGIDLIRRIPGHGPPSLGKEHSVCSWVPFPQTNAVAFKDGRPIPLVDVDGTGVCSSRSPIGHESTVLRMAPLTLASSKMMDSIREGSTKPSLSIRIG